MFTLRVPYGVLLEHAERLSVRSWDSPIMSTISWYLYIYIYIYGGLGFCCYCFLAVVFVHAIRKIGRIIQKAKMKIETSFKPGRSPDMWTRILNVREKTGNNIEYALLVNCSLSLSLSLFLCVCVLYVGVYLWIFVRIINSSTSRCFVLIVIVILE